MIADKKILNKSKSAYSLNLYGEQKQKFCEVWTQKDNFFKNMTVEIKVEQLNEQKTREIEENWTAVSENKKIP